MTCIIDERISEAENWVCLHIDLSIFVQDYVNPMQTRHSSSSNYDVLTNLYFTTAKFKAVSVLIHVFYIPYVRFISLEWLPLIKEFCTFSVRKGTFKPKFWQPLEYNYTEKIQSNCRPGQVIHLQYLVSNYMKSDLALAFFQTSLLNSVSYPVIINE